MRKHEGQAVEHLVSIFSWMLRLLPGESAERVRTLAKFVEKNYEKVDKLLELRREYAGKVAAADAQMEREGRDVDDAGKEAMAGDWVSRRLEAGLFCLQTVDVVLAWLVAEDDGAREKIRASLADRGEGFDIIRATIQEQLHGMDPESADERETRDVLVTLLDFLQ